jgi:hypothetical protein
VRNLAAALLLVLLAAACTTGGSQGPADETQAPSRTSAGRHNSAADADSRVEHIYAAVLRRYLLGYGPPSGDHADAMQPVCVVAHGSGTAADLGAWRNNGNATPVSAAVQRQITKDLADITRIRWVDDEGDVIVGIHRCPHVRRSGVVISLAPVPPNGDRLEIAVGGFTACLGATTLTYVVQPQGNGWAVTGTTGGLGMA